jgi:hypothetical protein
LPSLFNPDPDPDPDAEAWLSMIPSNEDLANATAEQLTTWYMLNAEIAFIHTAWANLETHLAHLLSSILRIKIAQAVVILGTLMANKPKRDLIYNSALISLQSEQQIKKIERTMRRTAKVASKRNFLAHGMAMYHQKYPMMITVYGISADQEPALSHYLAYSQSELIKIRDTINAISEHIGELCPVIWRARRKPLPQTPMQKSDDGLRLHTNHRRPKREKSNTQPRPSPRK